MSRIDRKLEKLGYKKIKDDNYGTMFRWRDEGLDRTKMVAILHKESTHNIIQVYDPDHTFEAFTAMDALTLPEMKLFLKKFKQMVRKYKW